MPAGTRHKSQIPHLTNLRYETVRSFCEYSEPKQHSEEKIIIINDEHEEFLFS